MKSQKKTDPMRKRRAVLGLFPTFINIYTVFLTTLTEATSSGASLNLHTQLFQTGIKKKDR